MPALTDLNNDILQVQTRLQQLRKQKSALSADYALCDQQRPPGIPLTWQAQYDGSGVSLRITAWYDPAKYGIAFRAIP